MRILLVTFVALLFPSIAQSQTHCRKGENIYFSCKTTANEKVISVCGNITNGEITDDSWLQYRFGKIGAIELAYPNEKQGSISKFEGNYFVRYNVIDLRFINGKNLYGVHLNGLYSGNDAQERTSPSGGISIEIGKAKRLKIECEKGGTEYFGIFGQLNASLTNYNGQTDFLYDFYKQVSK